MYLKLLRRCLLAIAFLCVVGASALSGETARGQIIDSADMSSIDPWITSDTIVLLDLDNTLFRPTTSLGSAQWFTRIVQGGIDAGFDKITAANIVYPSYTRAMRFTQMEPCDSHIPDLMRKWQKRAYAVIGLTARWPVVAPRTVEQLRACDVVLGEHRWKNQAISFDTPIPACFLDGIIFANENDKSEILALFLDQANHKGVKRLVLVDDALKNLHTVRREAEELQLEFVGLRYGMEDARVRAYNHELSRCQLHFLDSVLPDSLAEHLLSTSVGRDLLAHYIDPIVSCKRQDKTLVPTKQARVTTASEPDILHDIPVRISDSTHIADLLELADKDTLIVFDLNDTLFQTHSSLGGDVWADRLLQSAIKAGLSKEEALDRLVPYWHQVLLRVPVKPVEAHTAHVLTQLAHRGCKMIGLTARYTEMAYSTLEALRSISIDFSQSSAVQDDCALFTPCPAKCIEGVIFAGLQNDKADVLVPFLRQNPIECTKTLFIDDKPFYPLTPTPAGGRVLWLSMRDRLRKSVPMMSFSSAAEFTKNFIVSSSLQTDLIDGTQAFPWKKIYW